MDHSSQSERAYPSRPAEQIGVGHLKISDKEKQYVNCVLDSDRLSYGPFSRRFEALFAELHGARHAVLSNSGTSALQVAVAALSEIHEWQPGDEVLVPATTFVATANIVMSLGLRPVFVDVDPMTYNMDPVEIERHITDRTRLVLPVHLYGLPADMASIMDIAERHGLRVVEDSCETMFVSVGGRPVGSHGDIGCFSTYVAHFLVTGVGGVSLTNDDELAIVMRSLCNHGRDSIYLSIDDDKGKTREQLAAVMERRFSFVRMGYSYRVTEMEAALGLAQLESYESILRGRQTTAQKLLDGLRHLEDRGAVQLPRLPAYADEHAFMLFPVVVTHPTVSRDAVTLHLEERLIETRPMMPLINQPLYVRLFGEQESKYPVAAWINRSGFYMACHQGLTESDIAYMINCLDEILS